MMYVTPQYISYLTDVPEREVLRMVKLGPLAVSLTPERGAELRSTELALKFLDRRSKTDASTGFLYLIHAIGTDRYKIGFAGSPKDRIKELRTGSPFPLVIIGTVRGTLRDEFLMHQVFSDYRVHGEWFAFPHGGIVKAFELLDADIPRQEN